MGTKELEAEIPDSQTSSILPRFLETSAVILIKDGAPGTEVDDSHSARDQQHEGELHHVADLHQHDGGDEGQHGHIVVILGVLQAAILCRHPQGAVVGSHVVLQAAQLRPGPREEQTLSAKAVVAVLLSRHFPSSLRNTEKGGKICQGIIQM